MNALPHHNKQKGAVLVLVTVALFVLLGFTALALDGGYLLLNKTRVQDAVDSAALSGAKTLSKTAAEGNTSVEARAAVYKTLQTIFNGDGFNQVDIDTDNIDAAVEVEFSHQAIPFEGLKDSNTAKYIRVRLNTVPVNQFFSQLMVDNWQVASAAVAGPEKGGKPQEQQVIPLLLCSKDTDDPHHGFNPSNKDARGDVIVVKTNHHNQAPVGAGNFLGLDLDGTPGGGANIFGDALSGDLNPTSVIEYGSTLMTEPGNMVKKSLNGLNTRFGKYEGDFKSKEPSVPAGESNGGAYYSDCAVPSFTQPITFNGSEFGGDTASGGNLVLQEGSNKWSGLQSFPDYYDGINSTTPLTTHCIDGRRIVKLPVANCDGNSKGKSPITVIDTVCMFLNQEVTGNGNNQYIVAEMLESCDLGSGGSGSNNTSERLVLYKDTASGDS